MWLTYLTYLMLLSSVISLWIPTLPVPATAKIKAWQILLYTAIIFSFFSQVTNLIGIGSIILFYYLAKYYQNNHYHKNFIIAILIAVIGISLEMHLVPGFHNLKVLDRVQFTPDAVPFTLYLNFDKTIVGLIVIGLTLKLAKTAVEWKALLKQVIYILPILVLVLLIPSIASGYVKFAPKLPQGLWIWVISNLFFTSLAEEGLFRGFIQNAISKIPYQYSEYIAILVSAILFGMLHCKGGLLYVTLAAIAGIAYGLVYKISRRIEASILTHFLFNLTHILFFTYPALPS